MNCRSAAGVAASLVLLVACARAHAVSHYDSVVIAADPSAFWDMSATASIEPDVSGGGHVGTYRGPSAGRARLPDGEPAAHFNHQISPTDWCRRETCSSERSFI